MCRESRWGAGGPAAQQHSLPYLLLALGAPPHALGRGLEGRVQAAEVVGPRAGATRLQVGPSLAGSTELVMSNLALEEKGGRRRVGGAGRELGGPRAAAALTCLGPSVSQQLREKDEPRNWEGKWLPSTWTPGHHLGRVS